MLNMITHKNIYQVNKLSRVFDVIVNYTILFYYFFFD